MIETIINTGDARAKIQAASELLKNGRPLYKQVSQALEFHTEQNFEAQGRPDWMPLAAATVRERMKRSNGSSVLQILQDRGSLASSVSSRYGADFSEIGAGGAASDYAAAHQFGVTINRAPYSITIPARPYLPFFGSSADATIQPEAAESILDICATMLDDRLS